MDRGAWRRTIGGGNARQTHSSVSYSGGDRRELSLAGCQAASGIRPEGSAAGTRRLVGELTTWVGSRSRARKPTDVLFTSATFLDRQALHFSISVYSPARIVPASELSTMQCGAKKRSLVRRHASRGLDLPSGDTQNLDLAMI